MFVSSHQLAEVEQTCDRVAIIDHGRCILTGAVHDVLAAAARPTLLVGLDDLAAGAQRLTGAGFAVDIGGCRGGCASRRPRHEAGARDEDARRRRALRH